MIVAAKAFIRMKAATKAVIVNTHLQENNI